MSNTVAIKAAPMPTGWNIIRTTGMIINTSTSTNINMGKNAAMGMVTPTQVRKRKRQLNKKRNAIMNTVITSNTTIIIIISMDNTVISSMTTNKRVRAIVIATISMAHLAVIATTISKRGRRHRIQRARSTATRMKNRIRKPIPINPVLPYLRNR